jgi:CBS domain containing-hemolysin-like protein
MALKYIGENLLIFLPLSCLLWVSIFIVLGKSWLNGLLIGLLFGVLISLYSGLVTAGLKNQILDPDEKDTVNQGIVSSLRNAWYFGILFGLLAGFIFWLSMSLVSVSVVVARIFSIFLSLFFMGIFFGELGGGNVFLHYTLRLLLILERRTPFNYVRFLNYATRLVFLRRRGGGYEFIHLTLRDHFDKRKNHP